MVGKSKIDIFNVMDEDELKEEIKKNQRVMDDIMNV